MRTITLIIVHCSANKAGSAFRLADIDRYHRSLGWKGCGYHYVIPADGTIEKGRLRKLLKALHRKYPQALIVGHRDLNPQKACPCFDVIAEYAVGL